MIEHVRALTDLLERGAEQHPEAPAVIGKKRRLSYAELERESRALANALIAAGVKPGDFVGVLLGRGVEAVVSALAILRAGAAYAPLDPSAPSQRVRAIVEHARLTHCVTAKAWARKLGDDHGLELVSWDESASWQSAEAADLQQLRPDHDSIAYVLHTSGSTGKPKGVPLSHGNALAFVLPVSEFFSLSASDRLSGNAPLHFDLSVFDIYCALAVGAAVVVIPEHFSAFPKKLSSALAEHGITVWNSVVSTLALMEQKGALADADTSSLRLVLFSGEPMPISLLRKLKRSMTRATFFNVYGQTEANSSMCFEVEELPPTDEHTLPLGKPFPGFEVYALDETNQAIGPNTVGDLYVASPTLGRGYLDDPEQSANKYVVDPRDPGSGRVVYRTGDRVRLLPDGNFVYAGRADNLVKSRGYRVELAEVELALMGQPQVHQAVVVAIPDQLIGNRLVAFAELEPEAEVGAKQILAACSEKLPPYMVPAELRLEAHLPKTSSGKVDRQRLRTLAESGTTDED